MCSWTLRSSGQLMVSWVLLSTGFALTVKIKCCGRITSWLGSWTPVKRRVTALPYMKDCVAAPMSNTFTCAVKQTSSLTCLAEPSLSLQEVMSKFYRFVQWLDRTLVSHILFLIFFKWKAQRETRKDHWCCTRRGPDLSGYSPLRETAQDLAETTSRGADLAVTVPLRNWYTT